MNNCGNTIMPAQTFSEVLRDVATRVPDRPAVLWDGDVIFTYRSLWETAGNIALELVRKGCGRNQRVAIEIPKSPSAVAAILGVWRSGAAWVPIPPDLPDSIREFMLTDSSVEFSVIDSRLWKDDARNTDLSRPVLDLRQMMDYGCEDVHRELREPRLDPGDPAYVIYTSGTTGRPRGVVVPHRGLVPMLRQQINAIGLTEESRSLFLLSLTFDAAISDIGTALLSGAALCMESSVSQNGRLTTTPEGLLALIARRGVTYVDLPPSLLARMSVEQCPSSLQCVLIGGEVCPADVVRRWADRVRLVSVYGPTEATICTSMVVCDQTWDQPRIGMPLGGTTYRILNDESEGELLIGGIGLATEYVGQPALTAERFPVLDGTRYYRTGDCVRFQNGDYIFLGRLDRQVKVRGHRIEPEQVESVIQAHSGVRRCAVTSETDDSGRTKLVAFVSVDSDYRWTRTPESELRSFVSQSLPWWMVPSAITILENMPVTSTGKVDFQRLEHSKRPLLGAEVPQAPKLSKTAASVLAAMRHVLQRPDISADEHFSDAGGDSLRVVELIAVLQSQNLALPPAAVYRLGSARQIANHLDSQRDSVSSTVESINAEWLRSDVEPLVRELSQVHQPSDRGTARQKAVILLTGATGFLGIHVLKELLRQTDAGVVCLLRGTDMDATRQRLFNHLAATGHMLSDSDRQRIEVCSGDLCQEYLGLNAGQFLNLAKELTHIVHCAADISAISDYQALRSANVVGTATIARLARLGRRKRLLVASTLSVFVNTDCHRGHLSESENLTATKVVYGGYAQSKWAAEWFLRRCQSLLPELTIVRLGLLIPDPQSGPPSQNDLLSMTLRALVKLDCVPTCRPGLRMDSTPVSFAAAGMASLLMQESHGLSTIHIAHPTGISATQLFQAFRARHPKLQQLTDVEFRERICQRMNRPGENHSVEAMACMALSRRITHTSSQDAPGPMDLFLATDCDFDSLNSVQRILASTNTTMPEPEQLVFSLVEKILSASAEGELTTADDPATASVKGTAP